MRSKGSHWRMPAAVVLLLGLAACSDDDPVDLLQATGSQRASPKLQCAADNGGITLPAGFCAIVVADLVMDGRAAAARHMAVTPNGDLFVAINSPRNQNPSFGIIGLRDKDGDGKADEQTQFSAGLGGSGIAWGEGRLFFGANDRVLRFQLGAGQLEPNGAPEVVVSGLVDTGDHIS